MIDRTGKIILAAIAAALWLNLAMPLFSTRANADPESHLRNIEMILQNLTSGTCINRKLCGS